MKLSYDMLVQGVYIITAKWRGKTGGMAASWATQTDENRVAVCMGSQSTTRKLVLGSKAFGFHMLGAGQRKTGKQFGSNSSAKMDKFWGIRTRKVKTGAPIFNECIRWFDCRVEGIVASGDSKVIIGRIVGAGKGKVKGKPLIYRSKDYN